LESQKNFAITIKNVEYPQHPLSIVVVSHFIVILTTDLIVNGKKYLFIQVLCSQAIKNIKTINHRDVSILVRHYNIHSFCVMLVNENDNDDNVSL
jgi:hypothetical protein